jgi:hypothetical protein
VFVLGGRLIGKTFENNSYLQAVPSVFRDHRSISDAALPYQYSTAPIAALDVRVEASTTWGTSYGCATLSDGCRILSALGADLEPVDRVRPFTAEPLPWNTYTALDAPLIDGGLALCAPIVGILGLLVGSLWGLAQRQSAYAVSAYALLAPAMLTASGSFSFTASHLLGAILISSALLLGCGLLDRHIVRMPSRNAAEA